MTLINDKCDLLLIALKKVTQSIDLHSKQLTVKYGVTGPQILLLKTIQKSKDNEISSKELAHQVSLSQATVTSIMDRLCEKDYVKRSKTDIDKRKTMLKLTSKATNLLERKPSILQENFIIEFNTLDDWEQTLMLGSLERMASMMSSKTSDS